MKTDVAKSATGENINHIKAKEENAVVQGTRKSLRPLQKVAGNKELLVGAGRLGCDMPSSKEKSIPPTTAKNSNEVSVKKLKTSKNAKNKGITVEDLTSETTLSMAYWQQLCDKQRTALDAALCKNKVLNDQVKILEEENEQCRILLEETRALVDTLKEMLYEQDQQVPDDEANNSVEEKKI